jgi:hypothetical protein
MDERYSFLEDERYTGDLPKPMCSDVLKTPSWIDWNCTGYPLGNTTSGAASYRKITNLHGGDNKSAELKWLSEFNTGHNSRNEDATIYDMNPKYLWGIDTVNNKLKISKNNIDTLKKDPTTYEKNHMCSEKATTEIDKCVYNWNGSTGSCTTHSDNYFNKLQSNTKDKWYYYNDGNNDNPGTFCIKSPNTIGPSVYISKYIGCDCDDSNLANFSCSNIEFGGSCPNSDYTATDSNKWKFIDEAAAVACCTLTSKSDVNNYPQCKSGAFDPFAGSSKCAALMSKFCEESWGKKDTTSIIGTKCNDYLNSMSKTDSTVKITVQNFITDENRTPQNYISPQIYNVDKEAGKSSINSASIAYYDDINCNECCNSTKVPSAKCTDINCDDLQSNIVDGEEKPTKSCLRDDSEENGFFGKGMPYLCSSPANDKTVCDSQLDYFCAQFNKDHLSADTVLQNLCGCYLLQDPVSSPINPIIIGANHIKMNLHTGTLPEKSPYYSGLESPICDPICTTSKIGNTKCTKPSCIMDNVSINLHESDVGGDSTIFQSCEGGTCYIKDTSINTDKSTIAGRVAIKQNCDACYTFTDDLSKATQVKCGTLTNTGLLEAGEDVLDEVKSDTTSNITIIVVVIIVIIIIVGIIIYKNRKN